MCAVAETVTATFPDNSSAGKTVRYIDILCDAPVYVVCRVSVHAAGVYSVHPSLQVGDMKYLTL